jgi:hypothetical protein
MVRRWQRREMMSMRTRISKYPFYRHGFGGARAWREEADMVSGQYISLPRLVRCICVCLLHFSSTLLTGDTYRFEKMDVVE